jgi:hypothetical protein
LLLAENTAAQQLSVACGESIVASGLEGSRYPNLCTACRGSLPPKDELRSLEEVTQQDAEAAMQEFWKLPETLLEETRRVWKERWGEQANSKVPLSDSAKKALVTKALNIVPSAKYLFDVIDKDQTTTKTSLSWSVYESEKQSPIYEYWINLHRPYPVSPEDLKKWKNKILTE